MNTKEMILYDKKTPCQLTISPGSLWLRLYGLKLFVQNTMKKKKRQNIELKQVFQESREENPMFMPPKFNLK